MAFIVYCFKFTPAISQINDIEYMSYHKIIDNLIQVIVHREILGEILRKY